MEMVERAPILKRMYQHRFFPLFLCTLYLTLVGVDVYLFDHFPKDRLTAILKSWIPWNLRINFFLILLAVICCWRDLWTLGKRFWNKRGIWLGLLFVVTVFTTATIAPKTHRIFYDEDIYCNVAQNMAHKGVTGYCNYGTFEYGEYYPHWVSYNKEPSGWPYLISLGFQFFGTDESHAFTLNNLLLGAGVWIVFFIAWHVTGAFFPSFLSGLAYALMPHNLTWGNTAAAEPSAAFFAGVVVLLSILFFKSRQTRHLILLALVLPFACQMRAESGLIGFWVVMAFLVISPSLLAEKRLWASGLLIVLFLLPHFLHFYAVSGHSWGAQGSKFSLEFLEHNVLTNGLYYLDNRFFPVVITLLAAIGLLFSKKFLKWRLLILLWFLLFWGIFLFFYAGSYEYGADVRFALVSFMPLSVLAGLGSGRLRDWLIKISAGIKQRTGQADSVSENGVFKMIISTCVAVLMLFSFLKFLPFVRQVGQEAWGSRYDHKYAKEFTQLVPRRSIILTQNPTMFLLWEQNAIQTYAGINNPGLIRHLLKKYQGHVYFHDNYWCNTQNERNKRLCRGIRDRYELTEVAAAREQDYDYGLYRMEFKD